MEKVNIEKILGYFLLVIGLGVIIYSAFNVLSVFRGKTQPYQLFSFSPIGLDFSSIAQGQPIPDNVDLSQEIVAADLINQPSNTMAHFALMGFIASVGLKIAQIGVMLIRSIKVKLIGKTDLKADSK